MDAAAATPLSIRRRMVAALLWCSVLLGVFAPLMVVLTRTERQAPGFSPGSSVQAGTACCCSMYWRRISIGAPPQDAAK